MFPLRAKAAGNLERVPGRFTPIADSDVPASGGSFPRFRRGLGQTGRGFSDGGFPQGSRELLPQGYGTSAANAQVGALAWAGSTSGSAADRHFEPAARGFARGWQNGRHQGASVARAHSAGAV